MRIELSITADYVPNWHIADGIRDLVQNARDSEIQFGAPMKIDWYNGKLRIENDGVTLPTKALLLGYTTKEDNKALAGKWGEGLKLGILALVRDGCDVKIRNGSETWKPAIVDSTKFESKVLAFDITTGNKPDNRVRIEIGGVDKDTWLKIRQWFLFINEPSDAECVKTDYGDLLIGEKYSNRIFVKGIFVGKVKDLEYGYNFYDAEIDRDRKMVDSWDMQSRTSHIWTEAVARRPDLLDPFFKLAEEARADLSALPYISVDDDVAHKTARVFKDKFGNNAVPVGNLSESETVSHLGARGVVVSRSLKSLLEKSIGTTEQVLANLKTEVLKKLSWDDLSSGQQDNLKSALKMLSAVHERATLDMVDVVTYRSNSLCGQYRDGRVLISAIILNNYGETLTTLIHEFAHEYGGDGDPLHVAAIEKMWAGIVNNLVLAAGATLSV